MKQTIIATDKKHLKEIIKKEMKLHGNNCDLNNIDVSNVTDMSYMFSNFPFNGNISNWNTSNVTNMSYMFYNSSFRGDISKWNVSSVENMRCMFQYSNFNGDISNWNTSNVTDMSYMFKYSQFNGDISNWKPYSLEICKGMFENCKVVTPWWYSEEANEVIKKLNSHDVAQSLEHKLPAKVTTKKFKI